MKCGRGKVTARLGRVIGNFSPIFTLSELNTCDALCLLKIFDNEQNKIYINLITFTYFFLCSDKFCKRGTFLTKTLNEELTYPGNTQREENLHNSTKI